MALLAHGVPTVTTTGMSSEGFWRDANAASLVPAGDARALANEAARLVGDAPRRERLARAARALYAERFDITHVVAALRRVPPAVAERRSMASA